MNKIVFPVKKVPSYIRTIGAKLIENGFKAYLVGGSVRDLLLERRIKDYDITTNATPDVISNLFPKSVATGAKFGSIIVIIEDEYGEAHDVDVTTFRREENYFGGRWPSEVKFAQTIEEDLSRRDFTINAIAIDLEIVIKDEDQFLEVEQIIDPFGGIEDMLDREIRAVGNPIERFTEDGLRAFRACRLATELNFQINEQTKAAIKECKNVSAKVSMERIRDELMKMLKHSKKPSVGILLMEETGLLEIFLPELLENKNIEQPEWHDEDVYTHSIHSMDLAEDEIKLAALLHDVGKARTKTVDDKGTHFYNHDQVGAEMTKIILKRLRFSNAEVERISNLVKWHMFYYPSADWRKDNKNITSEITDDKNQHGWTDGAIRRFIRNVGGMDVVNQLIKLRIADAGANKKTEFNPVEIDALEKRIATVLEKEMVLKVTDLDISGNNLIELGIPAGPKHGIILNKLLEHVTEIPNDNSRETLITLAKSFAQKLI